MSVDEQLGWEAARRGRAGAMAIAAGVFSLGGGLAQGIVFSDYPADFPASPIAQALFVDDHALSIVALAALVALGTLLMAPALELLYRAAKARRPATPAVARVMLWLGVIALAGSQLARALLYALDASRFAARPDPYLHYFDAQEVFTSGSILVAQTLGGAGGLAVAFAFVIVSLSAMRAGLLTRFMGVLGIIVGALFVFPFGSQLPVVPSFWLIALGALFLGRWPNGTPPAWSTGEAEPWPTKQELREQRERARSTAAG